MSKKHSLHRRTHLLSGLPRFTGFPRRPLRSGTGPSTRHPEQACRFTERIGLTAEELDQIARRINSGGKSGQASGHVDPLLTASGAPSHESLNRLLDDLAGDLAAVDPPGKPDGVGDGLFAPEPSLLDLGTAPWPARNR